MQVRFKTSGGELLITLFTTSRLRPYRQVSYHGRIVRRDYSTMWTTEELKNERIRRYFNQLKRER